MSHSFNKLVIVDCRVKHFFNYECDRMLCTKFFQSHYSVLYFNLSISFYVLSKQIL